jgi:hypothetical protein
VGKKGSDKRGKEKVRGRGRERKWERKKKGNESSA